MIIIAVVAALAAASPASSTDCPVAVRTFVQLDHGARFSRYRVAVTSAIAAPTAVRLVVRGDANAADPAVFVPLLTPRESVEGKATASVLFVWPSADLTAVNVKEVIDLTTATVTQCPQAQDVAILRYPGVEKNVFDDSAETRQPHVIAHVITDPSFINLVAPNVSETDVLAGHQGDAIIEITIGPGGKVEGVNVFRSSGYYTLDNAALKAARESTFSEPTLNGKPVRLSYFVTYRF